MRDRVHELLEETEELGSFQKCTFLMGCVAMLMAGMSIAVTIFISLELPHRCLITECESRQEAEYTSPFLNFTVPLDDAEKDWNRCFKFSLQKESIRNSSTAWYTSEEGPDPRKESKGKASSSEDGGLDNSSLLENPSEVGPDKRNPQKACQDQSFSSSDTELCSEWIYDTSTLHPSAISEFNLVCDQTWLQPSIMSIFMLGRMLGSVVLGDLADRIGRKKAILISTMILSGGGLMSSAALRFPLLLIAKLLEGIGNNALIAGIYLLVVEFVPSKWRSFCGNAIMIPFSLGEAFVALTAYLLGKWRWMQFITSALPILILSYWWLMPESILWLLAKGEKEKAADLIQKVLKFNQKKTPNDPYKVAVINDDAVVTSIGTDDDILRDSIKNSGTPAKQCQEERTGRRLNDLLTSSVLRKRTLILWFTWISIAMSYYGLSSNVANLNGNVYANFASVMIIEIPGFIAGSILLDRIGRKGLLVTVLWFEGLSCLASGLIPEEISWLVTSLCIAGKFGSATAFGAIFTFTSELYPTPLRAFGMGTCSAISNLGSVLAPILANLARLHRSLPLLVFGSLAISSGSLIVLLPETLGQKLAQTVEECEKIGRGQSVFYFSCCKEAKMIGEVYDITALTQSEHDISSMESANATTLFQSPDTDETDNSSINYIQNNPLCNNQSIELRKST